MANKWDRTPCLSTEKTSRVKTIKALREAQEYLDKIINAIADPVLVKDCEHRFVLVNDAECHLIGKTREEIIGRTDYDFFPKEQVDVFYQKDEGVFETGVENINEEEITDAQGITHIIVTKRTLYTDPGGDKYLVAIIRDITERKKLEAQFLRAQRFESIGALASGISHDLNNILGPIMMASDLLKEEIHTEEGQKILEMLAASTRRGADLVKQVLTFARGAETKRILVQLRHILKEVFEITQATFPKNIQIKQDYAADLWTVTGDPTQIHQVLMNLCVNASHSMPDGGTLTITAQNRELSSEEARHYHDVKPGRYVVATISDTGAGIPPDIINKIFDPFFTTKSGKKGSGLGLSTALAIVKSHGGFMDVATEVGEGTAFMVYLPVSEEGETEEVSVAQTAPRGNGELIMVVDDEASVRSILRTLLESNGYRVVIAEDGVEAMSLYTGGKEEIHAVLLDLEMPYMDGIATVQALRAINPKVKIIINSGYPEAANRLQRELEAGDVRAVLPKPVESDRLLTVLHQVITA
jgi:PAS domain S-box-containing protein